MELMKRFGHHGDDHYFLGTNAKASEFQAAMGLCNFKYLKEIINSRKELSLLYDDSLRGIIQKPSVDGILEYNYSYYPAIFKNEEQVLMLMDLLGKQNIFPRRYFYPSLNKLPYLSVKQDCPVSEDIASRILCLPLYPALNKEIVTRICEIIKNAIA
jgi:dTDP-4-amino-4,6-dideoxygalactose transaminase